MVTTESEKYTAKEARAFLVKHGYDVTTKTIRRMCVRGDLTGAKKLAGTWYIPPATIKRLIGADISQKESEAAIPG